MEVDERDVPRRRKKMWQHVKRGVPLRVEIGPRDLASDSVFLARRDQDVRDKAAVPRAEFLARVATILAEMQENLRTRAEAFREKHTRRIDDPGEFEAFFTSTAERELHGGFALSHYAVEDGAAAAEELLKRLKVTARCIPLDSEPRGRPVSLLRPAHPPPGDFCQGILI